MNREIKFRAQDAITGQWVYGHYHEGSHANYISTYSGKTIAIDPTTLGQWIGAKDRHEIDIFHNDIVRYSYKYRSKAFTCLAQIVWDNGWVLSVNKTKWVDHRAINAIRSSLEVIGNVHENPNLLS